MPSTFTMPPARSTIDRCTRPVPCMMGYSALFDTNMDEVFTRLNLPSMDFREVVPYTTVDYPSRDNVSVSSCPFLSFLIQFLVRVLY